MLEIATAIKGINTENLAIISETLDALRLRMPEFGWAVLKDGRIVENPAENDEVLGCFLSARHYITFSEEVCTGKEVESYLENVRKAFADVVCKKITQEQQDEIVPYILAYDSWFNFPDGYGVADYAVKGKWERYINTFVKNFGHKCFWIETSGGAKLVKPQGFEDQRENYFRKNAQDVPKDAKYTIAIAHEF